MSIQLKKKQKLFFRIALAALLVWIVIMLLDHTIETVRAGSDVSALQEQIDAQRLINEQLEIENANIAARDNSNPATNGDASSADGTSPTYHPDSEFYLEQYARDRGYSYSGEIIFIETPGN